MPGYKAHVGAALVFGGACLAGAVHFGYLGREALPLTGLLLFFVLGGVFPDVDTDTVGKRLFYGIVLAADLFLLIQKRYEWAAWAGLLALLPGVTHHRGWTHTRWAMLVAPLPILFLPVLVGDASWRSILPYYLSFAGGYFSHLALDRKFL
jgi:membrane-bound metal-dependent hydrolase YbcI (DUF457 family)